MTMADDNSGFLADFLAEAQEHLDAAEAQLLILSRSPQDADAVQACFRSLHSIKGGAGFLGLERVQALAHAAEHLLDLVRSGTLPCGPVPCQALLAGVSRLGQLLGQSGGDAQSAATAGDADDAACIERLRSAAHSSTARDYTPGTDALAREHPVQRPEATSRRHDVGAAVEVPRHDAQGQGTAAAITQALARAASDAASGAPRNAESTADLADFAAEAQDLLAHAEAVLLAATPTSFPVDEVFRALHSLKGLAAYVAAADISDLVHELEERLAPQRQDPQRSAPAELAGGLLQGIDRLRVLIAAFCAVPQAGPTPAGTASATPERESSEESTVPSLAEILVDQGVSRVVVEHVTRSLRRGERLADKLVETGVISAGEARAAEQRQKELAKAAGEGFARVATGRLEELMNLVGELIIVQSQVSQDPAVAAHPALAQVVARQARIVRDLQGISLGLRMVPLRATFQKMARAVHDTATKTGKEVALHAHGEDTEIDRILCETLADPLLHMVRNAVDHGIEPPAERERLGKPRAGALRLTACQGGGQIAIELSDDGRGMDPGLLRAKAIEKGLIAADAVLDDRACYDLIFLPGFSTAAAVTSVSGRGVGMDVVKRNVEKLNGQIEIRSQRGAGSTFTIRLPLTTAILDAMLLRSGDQRFLLPVTSLVEALQPQPGQIAEVLGRGRVIPSRGRLLPVIGLADLFGHAPVRARDDDPGIVVVVEHFGGRFALIADDLLGLQQVVIKPLDALAEHHAGVAGSAILGDGRVGLILDPAHLLPHAAHSTAPD